MFSQYARREYGGGDLGHDGGGERALLGWFDDDGVARHQRRGHAGDGHVDRVVESQHAADDAVGFAQGKMDVLGGGGDALALHLVAHADEEFQAIDAVGQIGAHGGDGVAGVGDFDLQDTVGLRGQGVGQVQQIFATLGDGESSPGGLGVQGGVDGAVHVGFLRTGDAADIRFRGRVDAVEPRAVGAFDEFATDEHQAGVG